jgi:thiosulfate reductase cytochrome b subunit
VNSIVFAGLLSATGQFIRIIPYSWDVFPNAVSAGLQYASLDWPTEDGWINYNSLQVLPYLVTVFIAAPLAAMTGLRMSPLWPARSERFSKAYPVEFARAIHFPVMIYFVIVHVTLVLSTGQLRNLNHMYSGRDTAGWRGAAVFIVSLAAMAGGWIAVRPFTAKQVGAIFGRISR